MEKAKEDECLFQSTLPARGATYNWYDGEMSDEISIHAPRTGSDLKEYDKSRAEQISIHAPRTGSDTDTRWFHDYIYGFQSTLPARGATRPPASGESSRRDFNPRSPHGERPCRALKSYRSASISIHAPRTGSDGRKSAARGSSRCNFNPRSPHGERPEPTVVEKCVQNFNPRSPHGERRCSER